MSILCDWELRLGLATKHIIYFFSKLREALQTRVDQLFNWDFCLDPIWNLVVRSRSFFPDTSLGIFLQTYENFERKLPVPKLDSPHSFFTIANKAFLRIFFLFEKSLSPLKSVFSHTLEKNLLPTYWLLIIWLKYLYLYNCVYVMGTYF